MRNNPERVFSSSHSPMRRNAAKLLHDGELGWGLLMQSCWFGHIITKIEVPGTFKAPRVMYQYGDEVQSLNLQGIYVEFREPYSELKVRCSPVPEVYKAWEKLIAEGNVG